MDADVARAWTLPADLYHAAEALEAEREKIFSRTWQVVGRSQQVKQAGDYFTAEVAGEPMLVARDEQGRLHAFYNVCRHRAGPPATGCGSRRVFRCGYHGWTYGLDGRLITATEMDGVADFRPEEFSLAAVQVDEWFGLVLVNLDPKGEALRAALRPLPAQAERYSIAEMRLYQRREYEMACNWKTYVDNYLEGYHLPSVHPGLNRELDYNRYTTETYARHSRQWSPIRAAAGDGTERRYSAQGEQAAEYFWVFPNWMLNCYPDHVSVNIILPLAPERTLAIFEWYFPEPVPAGGEADKAVQFSHQIQLEDGAICEAVQRNLRSRSYQRGRFSARQERGVHHFHRLYAEFMNA